jgi:signal transduction histidine kinase
VKPLPLKEKEYRLGLQRTERRAIIPIKWFMLIGTAVLYLGLIRGRAPAAESVGSDRPVLVLLGLYAVFNVFLSYMFYIRGVRLDQVKPLTLISYLIDVVFVAMIIYFDTATFFFGRTTHPNFYILLFLLVMRGFALFATMLEIVFVNSLISLLFILILYLQNRNFAFADDPEFVVQIVLMWLVVLMGWLIMVIVNQQKIDLIRTNDKLMRTSYLARLGELSAGVAHEINNPLGIIISTAEYLKRGMDPSDPRREEIEAIFRESHRCKDIVSQMLTYANPRATDASLIDPAALNDEVLHFVFPKGRTEDIEVVREYDSELPPLKADPNLIKQALLNLYLNAKQALPNGSGGRIVSRIHGQRRSPGVTFEIEDNGCGINPEDLEHVFDPFFTRKPQGSGLGLSVTQKIVETFGGTISLDPANPKGTVVRMQFPAASVN